MATEVPSRLTILEETYSFTVRSSSVVAILCKFVVGTAAKRAIRRRDLCVLSPTACFLDSGDDSARRSCRIKPTTCSQAGSHSTTLSWLLEEITRTKAFPETAFARAREIWLLIDKGCAQFSYATILTSSSSTLERVLQTAQTFLVLGPLLALLRGRLPRLSSVVGLRTLTYE